MRLPRMQDYQRFRIPFIIVLVGWALAFKIWYATGDRLAALFVAYLGLFAGAGIGVYVAQPPIRRPQARRPILLMVGGLLLLVALVSDHGNMQIEGLFFGVLTGVAPYIILHYALAKVFGPLVFGRVWCGWACWFAMVLDLLPYPYSRYRIPGRWGWLRYAHFGISLLIVLIVWFGFRHSGDTGQNGMAWFIGGLALYYAVGIGLAFALKDNRAFCKYVCPIAVILKTTARFSLLKVGGTPTSCDECQACVEMCPMNIRVRDYILSGERVLSTECTLCQTCINVCPDNTLKLTLGFDIGGKEYIDYEPPRTKTR